METQPPPAGDAAPDAPSRPAPPAVRSWFDQAAVGLATGAGVGFFPVAPGTVGSLWGPPLIWGLAQAPGVVRGVTPLLLVVLGIPAATRAARLLGKEDPGPVVIDEIAAFPVTFAPWLWSGHVPSPAALAAGFFWFRVFDVLKPWPAYRLEHLPGGWGIMADDLMAGVYAAVALWGTMQLLG